MNFEIIHQEEIRVCGLPILLCSSQKENYKIITQHWREFNTQLKALQRDKTSNWKKFAIVYKEFGQYYYMPSIPLCICSGFTEMTIPAGKYSKFEHKGNLKFLKDSLYTIYKEVIPNRELAIDSDRSFIHYEYYDARFHWTKLDSVIDILVPIVIEH